MRERGTIADGVGEGDGLGRPVEPTVWMPGTKPTRVEATSIGAESRPARARP
jgi:hypothetical protein